MKEWNNEWTWKNSWFYVMLNWTIMEMNFYVETSVDSCDLFYLISISFASKEGSETSVYIVIYIFFLSWTCGQSFVCGFY